MTWVVPAFAEVVLFFVVTIIPEFVYFGQANQ
jgi:hypothetical protein